MDNLKTLDSRNVDWARISRIFLLGFADRQLKRYQRASYQVTNLRLVKLNTILHANKTDQSPAFNYTQANNYRNKSFPNLNIFSQSPV